MKQSASIVILGASYAGAAVAHQILKEIHSAHVTLVNPSELFYFNIAAPRVLAKPNENALDDVLISIPAQFKQYPQERFEFTLGTATRLDLSGKMVYIDGHKRIPYDYIIIATGSSTPATIGPESIPFKATRGNDIRERLQNAQSRVRKAKSVIIAGAGPVGVETAGEIAEEYKDKSVTLISSHAQVLPGLKSSAASTAEANLRSLGVKILKSIRVTDTKRNSGDDGWSVRLDNGKSLTADLFISAAGNVANSSFIGKDYVDADGWIRVDAYLRLPRVSDHSAYALGDVTTFKDRYMLKAQSQVPVVVANVKADIMRLGALATYKANDKLMVFVPTGSKSGTAQVGNFVLWSFLVAFAKSKDYFIPKASSYIRPK